MKRTLTVAMLLLVSATMIFANGEKETKTVAPVTEQKLEGDLVSATPREFSIFLTYNNAPFDSNWMVWKEIAKRTNISLKGIIPQSNSSEEEAFNLMLSSGDLADIICYKDDAVIDQLGRDGGVIALNDLIDQYAPNIKAYMEKDSKFKGYCYSLDGNIYQIPKSQQIRSAEYYFIRKDWLDKLGLSIPTNVDELYKVMTAFRNEDPNGNGLKDEIPYFDRAGWKMPDEILNLWDSSTEFYPRDGKMTFEPMTENFKYATANAVKWYKEGLVDPEIFTRGGKSRDILFSANNGGFTHDWVSTANYTEKLQKDIPGFEIVAMLPPADQFGVVKERTSRQTGVGWAISSSCKDPVTLIKFMDYFFTESGSALTYFGIEGVTYNMQSDGSIKYTDMVMNDSKGRTPIDVLRSIGINFPIGSIQRAEYEYGYMTGEGLRATQLYNTNDALYPEGIPPYIDGRLKLKYYPEEEAEYQKIMANIRPYVDEKFQSWMLGSSDFEADYDGFIKELKARGVQRAIEINQSAYDVYLGKK
jgi:putative aldouronate transport system substrate-binding protein